MNTWDLTHWREHSTAFFLMAAVVAGAWILHRVIRSAVQAVGKRREVAPEVISLVCWISRTTIAVVAVLFILNVWGVLADLWSTILAILAAIAIGFVAGWSLLSNVFSTLLILFFRPFRIGESVEIPGDDVRGVAVDVNVFYTTLLGEDGRYVQVPNNTFFLKPVVRTVKDPAVPLYDQLIASKPYIPPVSLDGGADPQGKKEP